MQIVIEVRDDEYRASKTISEIDGDRGYIRFPAERIANGIILPEYHGRLIEANSVDKIIKPIEPSDAEWGMTAETAIRLIHDAFDRAPTIIPATKEGEEA